MSFTSQHPDVKLTNRYATNSASACSMRAHICTPWHVSVHMSQSNYIRKAPTVRSHQLELPLLRVGTHTRGGGGGGGFKIYLNTFL
jgi:hypothetical protein